MKASLLCFLLGFVSVPAGASDLLRRFAVFPLEVEAKHDASADKAWWKIREVLTSSRRFTVASRRFMRQKSIFKKRNELEPADAVVLGKLLDAHAIVTSFVKKGILNYRVYSGRDGVLLWTTDQPLSEGRPIGAQIVNSVDRMTRAFIAAIPFHGFQVRMNSIGAVLQTEGDVHLAKIDIGKAPSIQVGDQVQWVRTERKSFKPLYQGGIELEVYAQGEVLNLQNQTATVELTKFTSLKDLEEQSLVYLPKEALRLNESYALKNSAVDLLIREAGHLSETSGEENEQSSLAFLLEFLGSMALVLLVAL